MGQLERYGGSMMYYDAPLDDRGQVKNKQYFPLRLVVWQNPAKKESEVIVVKNYDITDRKLAVPKIHKNRHRDIHVGRRWTAAKVENPHHVRLHTGL